MQKKGNINFVLVGARATGKTVYLTSLYLNEKSITADDSKTIEYLKPMADVLLQGKYPSATSGNLHELMFNYKDDEFTLSLQIDDVDGHFLETLSENDEHTQVARDQLIRNLEGSEGIIFFFPYSKHFDIEAMKEFNYQIDTIISKLKKIYHNRKSLPIPAVIAISKWDDSPNFQTVDEENKAIKYLEENTFLKLAKEKIELNFSTLKIVPLSAIGNNISQIEPYNLGKPIEFFLKETFKNWISKIESLKENKEALLIFLSKVHFDMKIYNDGKYDKLYNELEREYAQKLFKELEVASTLEDYNIFEKKNNQLIKALLSSNQLKISEIKEKLVQNEKKKNIKKKVKIGSGISVISMILVGIVLMVIAWQSTKLLQKSESELFSAIETEYKTNNYTQALSDISNYQDTYENSVNIKHKNRVIEIKNLIEKKQVILNAKEIITDVSFSNIDKINEVLSQFSEMNIDKSKIRKQLIDKKSTILTKETFSEFIDNLENKNFEDAIAFIDRNWKSAFNEDNKNLVIKILNRKYNIEVEKILKDISTVVDFDEYTILVESLKKIKSLKENNSISQISYKAILNSDNEDIFTKKVKIQEKYKSILEHGISSVKVSFLTTSKENEPLGFSCDEEDEIILKIDSKEYNYRDENNFLGCEDNKISWKNVGKVFKTGKYVVNVIEEDLAEDDHYDNKRFSLNENDLIKLANHKSISKGIGNNYAIELKGQ